jgi:hypothetical protein
MRSKVKIAPQFSIAPKNCDWPGPATLSSLGQRIGLTEIVGIISEQRRKAVEREARLFARSPGRDDADLGTALAFLGKPLEGTGREEEQVGRHFRRNSEGHFLPAALDRRFARRGHVAHRQIVRRDDRRQAEGRLVARLVEARDEAARVGRLELGEQPARFGAGRLVGIIEREEAVRLGVDDAGIVRREAIGARRDRRGGGEGHRLRCGIGCGGQRDGLAVGTGQRRVREIEIERVHHDRRRGLVEFKVDGRVAGEGQRLRVGRDADVVVERARDARELARHAGVERRAGGRRHQRGRWRGCRPPRLCGAGGEAERRNGANEQMACRNFHGCDPRL